MINLLKHTTFLLSGICLLFLAVAVIRSFPLFDFLKLAFYQRLKLRRFFKASKRLREIQKKRIDKRIIDESDNLREEEAFDMLSKRIKSRFKGKLKKGDIAFFQTPQVRDSLVDRLLRRGDK